MATSFAFSHPKERSATSRLDALTKTGVVSPSRKKWDFNPRAKVRANGEIPTLKVELSHRLGENDPIKKEVKGTLAKLREDKQIKKTFHALRAMTTATGKKCSLNENGKLKIGNRFANKAEQTRFAVLTA